MDSSNRLFVDSGQSAELVLNLIEVLKMKEPIKQVFNQKKSSKGEEVWNTFNVNKPEKGLTFNMNGLDFTLKYKEDYILSIILDWNTEWFCESSDSKTPNQLSPFGEGTGLKTCYDSLEEYQSAYIPLILIEGWAQIHKDFTEEIAFNFVLRRGPDTNNERKTNKTEKFDNFLTLNLEKVVAENEIDVYPSKGQLLILETTRVLGVKVKVFGYVVKRQSIGLIGENYLLKYVVAVSEQSMAMFGTDTQNQVINAKPFHYLRQMLRHITSLSKLKASPLLNDILKPRFSSSEIVVPTNLTLNSNKLNVCQSRTIVGISHAVNSPYTVPKLVFIQGPPGTGKTFTLIETLKHIYMNWNSEKRLPHILICAPSNGAVNEICDRIYRERDFLVKHRLEKHRRELRCVRVGYESKIQGVACKIWLDQLAKDVADQLKGFRPRIQPNGCIKWLDKVLKDIWDDFDERQRIIEKKIEDLKTKIKRLDLNIKYMSRSTELRPLINTKKNRTKLMDEYYKLVVQRKQLKFKSDYKIRIDIMNDADIILSTLNGSHSSPIEDLFERYGSETFDCVIVDEASQCSEPELLMPLIYQMSKMILIGDPKQLSATVISKKASSLNLGRSLFERFHNHFQELEKNNLIEKSPVLMLTEQYRMHPQICQFPSSQFYGEKLTTNSEIMKREFNRLKPYILFDVIDTMERSDSTNKSFINLNEANFVIRLATLIDQMLNRFSVHKKSYTVGVITPYNGQKTYLIDNFQNKRFNNINIDINTVDGFQGQERDIIIFSGVRAFHRKSNRNSIGFLDSVQRMNVALTRAKYSMILCISGHTFKTDKNWKSLIDDTIRRTNIRFKVSSISASNHEIKKILAQI